MKTRLLALILTMMLLVSCGSKPGDFITLGPRWAPMRRVQQSKLVAPGGLHVELTVVLVRDLDAFLDLDKVDREAALVHEQYHAVQQQELGLRSYEAMLGNNPAFRAKEEREGWRRQVVYTVRSGGKIDPYWVATVMSQNYGGVFEFNSTLAWVAQLISDTLNGKTQEPAK